MCWEAPENLTTKRSEIIRMGLHSVRDWPFGVQTKPKCPDPDLWYGLGRAWNTAEKTRMTQRTEQLREEKMRKCVVAPRSQG